MFKRFAPAAAGLFLLATLAAGQAVFYGVSGQGGNASSLYTINSTTGAATLVGATGFSGVGSLAVSPGGTLYGIAGNSGGSPGAHRLISINTSTGAGTAIGTTGVTENFTDVAFRSDSVLFGMTGAANLYTINTTTGVATLIGGGSGISTGGGLAFNSANTLYVANGSNLQTVNTSTGALTNVVSIAFANTTDAVVGMKFSSGGVLYGSAWSLDSSTPSQLVTLDTSTGAMVSLGSNGVRLEAIAITSGTVTPPVTPPATPIPSTLLLMGTSILALASWMFWRRRAVS